MCVEEGEDAWNWYKYVVKNKGETRLEILVTDELGREGTWAVCRTDARISGGPFSHAEDCELVPLDAAYGLSRCLVHLEPGETFMCRAKYRIAEYVTGPTVHYNFARVKARDECDNYLLAADRERVQIGICYDGPPNGVPAN